MQKQQAFEAEIAAKQSEYNKIMVMGKKLVNYNHYRAEEIEQSLDDFALAWKQLQETTAQRGYKDNVQCFVEQIYILYNLRW